MRIHVDVVGTGRRMTLAIPRPDVKTARTLRGDIEMKALWRLIREFPRPWKGCNTVPLPSVSKNSLLPVNPSAFPLVAAQLVHPPVRGFEFLGDSHSTSNALKPALSGNRPEMPHSVVSDERALRKQKTACFVSWLNRQAPFEFFFQNGRDGINELVDRVRYQREKMLVNPPYTKIWSDIHSNPHLFLMVTATKGQNVGSVKLRCSL
jgi:hypothetical protein